MVLVLRISCLLVGFLSYFSQPEISLACSRVNDVVGFRPVQCPIPGAGSSLFHQYEDADGAEICVSYDTGRT